VAARARRRELLIELIDGVPAGEAPLARVLLAGAARADYRGLVVRAQPSAIAAPSIPAPAAANHPAALATRFLSPPPQLAIDSQIIENTGDHGAEAAAAAIEGEGAIEGAIEGLDFDAEIEDVDADPDAEGDFDADA